MSNNTNVNCTNVNKIYLYYLIHLSLETMVIRMDGFNRCILKDFSINKYRFNKLYKILGSFFDIRIDGSHFVVCCNFVSSIGYRNCILTGP